MRLLDLIFYLLKSNSRITIKELAKTFGVSSKTIQRDLDKLSVLGIPIITYRGKDGGVEIDKNYIIARQILKHSDYYSLLTALYIGEHLSKNISRSYLTDKFKLLDPDIGSRILTHLNKNLIIDLPEHYFNLERESYQKIDQALDDKLFINLKMNNQTIEALPLTYVLRPEGLCLYCYTGEYLLIRIANILNVSLTNRRCTEMVMGYRQHHQIELI